MSCEVAAPATNPQDVPATVAAAWQPPTPPRPRDDGSMRAWKRLGRLTVALGALALVTAGCGLGGGDQQAQPPVTAHKVRSHTPTPTAPETSASAAPTTSTPTPSPTEPASTDPAVAPSSPAVQPSNGSAPRLVRYPGDGVTVQGPADATKLHGTSKAFRTFVLANRPQGSSDCSGGGAITVEAYRADGFAVGDVFSCPGGHRAIWGTNGGASWRELMGSQDVWSCKNLERYQVPTSIAGDKCFADGKLQDYRQS